MVCFYYLTYRSFSLKLLWAFCSTISGLHKNLMVQSLDVLNCCKIFVSHIQSFSRYMFVKNGPSIWWTNEQGLLLVRHVWNTSTGSDPGVILVRWPNRLNLIFFSRKLIRHLYLKPILLWPWVRKKRRLIGKSTASLCTCLNVCAKT